VIIRILDYLRRHAIALTALGCSLLALGGASYAAISIPNSSVGTAQLRNGAVTPAKVNRGLIGGYVRAWAQTNNGCQLVASSGGARIVSNSACTTTGGALTITWRGKFPRSRHACVAVGIPSQVPGATQPAVEADYQGGGRVIVPTAVNPSGGGQGVTVVLIC
jgi:hypothetical protein